MVGRGRPSAKKPPPAQLALPDPQTEHLPNAEDAPQNDVTSDETFRGVSFPAQRSTKSPGAVYRRSKRCKRQPVPAGDEQPAAVGLDAVETVNRVELPSNLENHPPNETNNVPEELADKEKSPEVTGMDYRMLYMHSQKKVKSLTKQNRMLRKQLERALGKVEAYDELTPTLASLSKANQILSTRPWTKTKGLRS